MADANGEAQRTHQDAVRLRSDTARLDAALRSASERAAAAEAQVQAKTETVKTLFAQLSTLRERWVGGWGSVG